MSSATLTTPQAILDSRYTELRFVVYINGIPTDCTSYSGQHGVDQPIATARLEMDLPRPDHVVPGATVEVHAGWNELVGVVFSGRIPARESALSLDGATLTLRAVGWASLLAESDRWELAYDGPISLRDLFIAMCDRAGVPAYIADETTSPDGSLPITLGASGWVDGGKVIIPSTTTPLQFLNNAAEPYGYRVYDTPGGPVRLSRISGMPPVEPVVLFAEGEHLENVRREHDTSDIVNWWDVRGATVQAASGETIPIRSIASSVPPHPDIPGGYRYKTFSNTLIETVALADVVRQRLEIDHSAPYAPVSWDAIGIPGVAPGDIVRVEAPTVETTGTYWLMSVDLSIDDRDGLSGRYTGWSGAGVPLAHGLDRVRMPLETGPLHLGNTTYPNYWRPTPNGLTWSWTRTIPERAGTINVVFRVHGSNNHLLEEEKPTGAEPSKIEVWRPGADKPDSTHPLPSLRDKPGVRYGSHLDEWTWFAVSLRATDPGPITITVVSGVVDKDAGEYDDFELRDVRLDIYESGEPALPRVTT